LDALRAPGLDPVSLAVEALLNAAAAAPAGYVLVLDDYHLLRDPIIQESVDEWGKLRIGTGEPHGAPAGRG